MKWSTMRFDRPGTHAFLHPFFFQVPTFRRLFRKTGYRTHSGTDKPGGQEALAYKGILRWSLIMIVIPILHKCISRTPGQDVSNSPILLIALLVYVRLDVSFE